MYSIVLAMALTPGNVAPAADIDSDIRDLKRSVAELRQDQTQARIDELKLVISSLRQRVTDDKLDELRRDVLALRHEEERFHAQAERLHAQAEAERFHAQAERFHAHSRAFYMPLADQGIHRATVAVEIPSGAAFTVNNNEVHVPAVEPVFVTPPLEPGRDYFYDCKVTLTRDGKSITKVKRVRVHAGEIVRINYEEMESR